jgi:hypothetical protein
MTTVSSIGLFTDTKPCLVFGMQAVMFPLQRYPSSPRHCAAWEELNKYSAHLNASACLVY